MRVADLVRYCQELGWSDPPPPGLVAAAGEPAPALRTPAPEARRHAVAGKCSSLAELERILAGCERCRLFQQRNRIVFGEGHTQAQLMLVGEAPGADEDRTGRPFVGQAGQLLDAIISALGFERSQVYIANILKCRPPGNRDPQPEETAACAHYLDQQIELIKPRVILALGRPAAQRLTGTSKPISALRGRWASYRGIPVMPTFHPAYLLRNPRDKRQVWQDLKQVRARLG